MAAQAEPIRHPAIACAEIQNAQGTFCFALQIVQNHAFEMTIAARADFPLACISATQVAKGKGAIVCAIVRTAAFGGANDGVLFKERAARGGVHQHNVAFLNSRRRWSLKARRSGSEARRRSKLAKRRIAPAEKPVTYDGG